MTSGPSSGDQDLVQWLLAAARKQPTPPPTPEEADAPEYDWHRPARYQAEHLARLDRFARDGAAAIARALSGLVRGSIALELKEFVQEFAWQIRQDLEGTDSVSIRLLGPQGQAAGVALLPAAAAVRWVDRLLGGASQSDRRELTPLEVDLLVDAVSAVTGAISATAQAAGGTSVTIDQEVRRGSVDLEAADADEFSRLVLVRPDAPEEPQFVLLLRSERLDGVAGLQASGEKADARDSRQRMLGHLAPVRVGPLQVTLGEAQLTLRDVMALERGDVVVLDRGADEPVDVVLQGRTMLHGHPVQCDRRYAAQILAWADRGGNTAGGSSGQGSV